MMSRCSMRLNAFFFISVYMFMHMHTHASTIIVIKQVASIFANLIGLECSLVLIGFLLFF